MAGPIDPLREMRDWLADLADQDLLGGTDLGSDRDVLVAVDRHYYPIADAEPGVPGFLADLYANHPTDADTDDAECDGF